MFVRVIAISITAALLASCGSTPVTQAEASPVPSDRIMWKAAESGYQIRVTRDSGSGAACAARVYINGKDAADLKSGETVNFTVPEGRNLLGAAPSPTGGFACPGAKEARRMMVEVDASGKVGDALYFRFGFGPNGATLSPTSRY